ncbi:IS21 family transposase [Oceanobacillus halotolerans]|uniref:IS21 family transposase n=1 Tax=Oceanobacillus halotolerans TaxID=2663380 RepID=UPI0013D97CC1|nr:IS21 family transposase [Oceanobacillus halotolerans]
MNTTLANNTEIDSLIGSDIEDIAIAADSSVKSVISYLSLDKNFVKKSNTNPDYQKIIDAHIIKASIRAPRKKYRYKVTNILLELIQHYINENKARVKKGQSKLKRNKKQIHQEIVNHGFDIHYSTTCRLISELEEKKVEAFIKCVYYPGQYCEFDWGNIAIYIDGKMRHLKAGVFTSAYSNYRYAVLYESENQKAFVDVHNQFFNHCRGVYQTIVYDNMSLAVNHRKSKNGKKKPSKVLKSLSKHHKFNHRFCNVRKGNEKGHVEKTIGVIKDTIFSKQDSFSSIEQANKYLNSEIVKLNSNESQYDRKTHIQRLKKRKVAFFHYNKTLFI